VYLVESGNLSPDVLSLAEGVVVSVVGIPDIIVVVVKAFECSRGDTSGNIKGFLDVLWGISPLSVDHIENSLPPPVEVESASSMRGQFSK
jgi:hypothetical protein